MAIAFPDGRPRGRLALLHVPAEQAEYRIAPGPVPYLVSAEKAVITGIPARIIGENRKLV